jgi:hypothetical protein
MQMCRFDMSRFGSRDRQPCWSTFLWSDALRPWSTRWLHGAGTTHDLFSQPNVPTSGATRRFRCCPSRGRWLRQIEVILANSRRWDDSLDVAGQVGGDYRRRLIARLPQRLSIDRTRQTETVQIEEAVSPRATSWRCYAAGHACN